MTERWLWIGNIVAPSNLSVPEQIVPDRQRGLFKLVVSLDP